MHFILIVIATVIIKRYLVPTTKKLNPERTIFFVRVILFLSHSQMQASGIITFLTVVG